MNRFVKSMLMAVCVVSAASAEDLVILHTNDTHSQIDPMDDGRGGVMRRKALIDSIKAVEPNVLLIDAGDAVQGTLFFNLFGGEVEHKVMEYLGYDMAIVGNHDFDNGVEPLAANIARDSSIVWLTTNYDLKESALAGLFLPYKIYKYGDRQIAFIALNLEPKGMISEGNYDGIKYIDAAKAANSTAWHLKHNEGIDMVIAITHVGYDGGPGPRDISLAANSEDIDIIIGGHSHTRLVDGTDMTRIPDKNGRHVLVTQTGSRGRDLGEIRINLDDLTASSRLIPVDSRLDRAANDEGLAAIIAPYRHGIDSIMAIGIAKSQQPLDETRLLNLTADMVLERGKALADNVDIAIVNKGGIRRTLPKGDITVGMIMTMLPFNNRVTVIDVTGDDLLKALEVMAGRGGDGIGGDIIIAYNDSDEASITAVTINGNPINPSQTYRIATIDYLANGGDYMHSLTNGKVVAQSDKVMYDDMIDYLKSFGKRKVNPSAMPRM